MILVGGHMIMKKKISPKITAWQCSFYHEIGLTTSKTQWEKGLSLTRSVQGTLPWVQNFQSSSAKITFHSLSEG